MTNIEFYRGAINAGDCIGNAWEQIKRNYGMYLGISLIAYILTSCIPCLNVFVIGPVIGGIYYVALRDMRGDPVEFGMMFEGFKKFVPLMVIGLIQAIPAIISQVLQYAVRIGQMGLGGGRIEDLDFYQSSGRDVGMASGMIVLIIVGCAVFVIFAIVWWAIFFFAVPLAFEYDLTPVDAIKLSARAGMANIGGLIVLLILQILVMLLGFLLICVGMFLISIPIMYVANAFAYRQVFPLVERNFNMSPPPPTVYGSNFGSGMQ